HVSLLQKLQLTKTRLHQKLTNKLISSNRTTLTINTIKNRILFLIQNINVTTPQISSNMINSKLMRKHTISHTSFSQLRQIITRQQHTSISQKPNRLTTNQLLINHQTLPTQLLQPKITRRLSFRKHRTHSMTSRITKHSQKLQHLFILHTKIGRASCREKV